MYCYTFNAELIQLIFSTSQEQYDSDEMAKEFLYSFPNQMFTVGQQLAFQFLDKKMLLLVVRDIEGMFEWFNFVI